MSITAMLNTGLSALLANQAALRTTASNIANVNTPGYVRRTVSFETQAAGGLLGGVEIASVKRAVAQFLGGERLSAASDAGSADAAYRFLDQLQAALGGVSSGRDPASRLSDVASELATLSMDPASAVRRAQLLQTLQDFTASVSSLADKTQSLRAQADAEIGGTITRANELIATISDLNLPIQRATLAGDAATPLRDQRDAAVRELASLIEIRVEETASGRVNITTPSGFTLVNQNTAEATHFELSAVGAGAVFPAISVVRRNAETGAELGRAQAFESHIAGGKLRGLLDLRDKTLPDIAAELGSLAAGAAEALNAAHNASSSWPAPASLTGRQTGLLASDSLGFTGKASLAVVTPQGALARRVDIDFDAGTLSVNGGASVPFTPTIGGLTAALNTALGGAGSASFSNGVLSLAASGGNGIAVAQDPATPADRAGRGFAQTFGLNDLLVSSAPTSFATGLSPSDLHGFTNGQQVNFSVRGPDGAVTRSFTYTVSGSTMGDVVTGLNAAAGAAGSFTLDAAGQLSFAPAGGTGQRLEIAGDGTRRGGTDMSLTTLFGLGQGARMAQAVGFSVRPSLNASGLALSQLDLSATASVGSIVLASADNKGALALQAAMDAGSFAAAGTAGARVSSLRDYATSLVAGIGQRAASASNASEDASALAADIEQRAASKEGVNMDEELAAMMMFQQAYNAGARIISTAQKLLDELMSIVR